MTVACSTVTVTSGVVMVDPNGGTPAGTTVCAISDNMSGRITGWTGYRYIVTFTWGISEIPPSNLKIGAC